MKRLSEIFEQRLQEKTGWGRNEIIELHRQCVVQVLYEQRAEAIESVKEALQDFRKDVRETFDKMGFKRG